MFDKQVIVWKEEEGTDDEVLLVGNKSDGPDGLSDGTVVAVYELKYTGTVKQHTKIVKEAA